MSDRAQSIVDLPIDLEPESVEQAFELLAGLAKALFPEGDATRGQLTWDEGKDAALPDAKQNIEDRLRHAEARFRALVEQIPAVTFMAVLGEGENEMYVSPHVEQLLGYTQAEWLGDPFLWYQRLHPDDRGLWNDEFARGCRRGGPFRAECRFLARDGRVVWVLGEARIVKDERGRPQFLQGVAFDITESKNAQKLMLETAVHTARMEEELEIARHLQNAILPKEPRVTNLLIRGAMLSAAEVGGDYYDVLPTPTGGWLAIGDVSGHGLNAGLVMLMVQSSIAAVTGARPHATPAEILALCNDVVFDNVGRRLGRDEYVTLTLLRYTARGHVEFAGAHQDVLVWRAATKRVERVGTPGTWIGIREGIAPSLVNSSLDLHEGDLLVLFSDGIIEAMNDAGELYDIGRLCEAIEEVGAQHPDVIRDHVFASVRRFTPRREDDMTLLLARFSRKGVSAP